MCMSLILNLNVSPNLNVCLSLNLNLNVLLCQALWFLGLVGYDTTDVLD